jgi:hypothetical protein
MKIEAVDELVWRQVTDLHQKSSLLKEEVKRQVLEAQGVTGMNKAAEAKKLQAKLKRLRSQAQTAAEALGNLESQLLLGAIDKAVYETAKQRLNDARQNTEGEINDIHLQLEGIQNGKRWVDWLSKFGEGVGSTAAFTDEQRKAYIHGILKRIDAGWNADTETHTLKLHFRLPIVGDRLRWIDSKKKSKGYEILDGADQFAAELTNHRKRAA